MEGIFSIFLQAEYSAVGLDIGIVYISVRKLGSFKGKPKKSLIEMFGSRVSDFVTFTIFSSCDLCTFNTNPIS